MPTNDGKEEDLVDWKACSSVLLLGNYILFFANRSGKSIQVFLQHFNALYTCTNTLIYEIGLLTWNRPHVKNLYIQAF